MISTRNVLRPVKELVPDLALHPEHLGALAISQTEADETRQQVIAYLQENRGAEIMIRNYPPTWILEATPLTAGSRRYRFEKVRSWPTADTAENPVTDLLFPGFSLVDTSDIGLTIATQMPETITWQNRRSVQAYMFSLSVLTDGEVHIAQ